MKLRGEMMINKIDEIIRANFILFIRDLLKILYIHLFRAIEKLSTFIIYNYTFLTFDNTQINKITDSIDLEKTYEGLWMKIPQITVNNYPRAHLWLHSYTIRVFVLESVDAFQSSECW